MVLTQQLWREAGRGSARRAEASAAVGESRAGGGQRQVDDAEGVRDQPDGLLDGASGQGDEEWRRAATQATQT